MFSRQQHRRIQISSPLSTLSLQVKQEVVGAIHFKGLASSPLKDQGANGRIQDCLIIHPQLWHKLGEPIFQGFPAPIDALRAGHAGKNIRVFHPGARSSEHFQLVADSPLVAGCPALQPGPKSAIKQQNTERGNTKTAKLAKS